MISNRIDFIYIFDVKDGNPNGDPNADNMPRIDDETGQGLVTDVCLKRKVRNYVLFKKEIQEGFDIYIKERAVLDSIINDVYKENSVKNAAKDEKRGVAQKILCKKYYDIRTFGAAITTTGKQDQVRGPIQFTFARSVDQIQSKQNTITRMAATKKAENNSDNLDDEVKQKERTMGNKFIVPYGLYVCHGFISANLAQQTGFSEEDLELFWDALRNMFDVDRSAARGLMSAQKLIVFRHNSVLGNAPADKLFKLVEVRKKKDDAIPRSFEDYNVTSKDEVEKKLTDLHLNENITVEYLI
ncbi:MAG: type I-C CRISPR-associated protein Cas7/Csd2 [Bacteroidales bacterium]|nr:type I-C CRISPR-associated protein Cas7/Csd2 [Bacteroidales bacterium]